MNLKPTRRSRRFALLILAILILTTRGAFAQDSYPVCEPPGNLDVRPGGPLAATLGKVVDAWLIPAPEANPAMLTMFRDRDRTPHRDLLPWSGEFAGKYLTGATEVLRIRPDERLEQRLRDFVAQLVALQDDDGYLGPFPRASRLTGNAPNVGPQGGPTWDAWGHYHVLLGLLAWHDHRGDDSALAAARAIGDLFCDRFLGDTSPRLVDTGSTEMNLAPAHGLCLLYRRTGEGRYLDLARQIVDVEFAATDPAGNPLAGDYQRRGQADEPFHTLPKPRWESLHPMMALAELAAITGEGRYAAAFRNLWWSIVELDRHNTGGFSSGEQAQGNPYHLGAIETCCTIAWMAMSVEMLKLTADPRVADELELSTLNAALGHYHPSGRWSTYNTPMDGVRLANSHEINFQCRPGSPELNCCSVNAARGLGLLGAWALLGDADGLYLNAYTSASLAADLPDGTRVRLAVETDYPVGDLVTIRVDPDRETSFPLRLRIPTWSAETELQLNGEPLGDPRPGTYQVIDRAWTPGDTITLRFDFRPRIWSGERELAGRACVYRGPILLAYDPSDNSGRPDEADPTLDAADLPAMTIVPADPGRTSSLLAEVGPGAMPIRLRDFATAGVDGTTYRTWLRIEGAPRADFSPANPTRTALAR